MQRRLIRINFVGLLLCLLLAGYWFFSVAALML